MNISSVAILLSLIILFYFVYKYMTSAKSTVSVSTNLASNIPKVTNVPSPGSMVYTFGIWTHVNTWNSEAPKNIFAKGTDFSLDLALKTPTLTCTIGGPVATASAAEKAKNVIEITDNFPVQTWVYIVISVNNLAVDCYLNGKLVLSRQLAAHTTGVASDITFGNFDCNIVNFTRTTTVTDPQTVWSTYLAGNGQSSFSLASYGLAVDLTKDGASQTKFTLL